ncbi:hypothetical protein DIPPA_04355 [Diplonema papillatum]|nr:hypothetical protein DIPPA_04355 [Diplonema papillatum]
MARNAKQSCTVLSHRRCSCGKTHLSQLIEDMHDEVIPLRFTENLREYINRLTNNASHADILTWMKFMASKVNICGIRTIELKNLIGTIAHHLCYLPPSTMSAKLRACLLYILDAPPADPSIQLSIDSSTSSEDRDFEPRKVGLHTTCGTLFGSSPLSSMDECALRGSC